jgi:hypothetical protein
MHNKLWGSWGLKSQIDGLGGDLFLGFYFRVSGLEFYRTH